MPVPILVDKLIPVPATKLPPTLPVKVLARIVPVAVILDAFNTFVLMVDALITLTLSGEVTRPVFVIVVTPPTVLRLMPAPAAKLFDILPLRVGAVTLVDALTEPHVTANLTFSALSILALMAEKLVVLIKALLDILVLPNTLMLPVLLVRSSHVAVK